MSKLSCQNDSIPDCSRSLSSMGRRLCRFRYVLRQRGMLTASMEAAAFILRRLLRAIGVHRGVPSGQIPQAIASKRSYESLGLMAGEWVEVKSRAEIQETLDAQGRCRGLIFMGEMAGHCGKRFRVKKRLEQLLDEGTGEVRLLRDTVLLENSICEGVGVSCDRSCYFFWREAWLKRMENRDN